MCLQQFCLVYCSLSSHTHTHTHTIMPHYIFQLEGRNSILYTKLPTSIRLNENITYVLGLVDIITYNTISNVNATNNKFSIGNYELELPEGTYEIQDIEYNLRTQISAKDAKKNKLQKQLQQQQPQQQPQQKQQEDTHLLIQANKNTYHCEIKSNKVINFDKENSIGSLLGFNKRKLEANVRHISDYSIDISSVNSISVECNLVGNSFRNNVAGHILYTFAPNVLPGYKIIEKPSEVTYLPINTNFIDEIYIKIVDQNGNLISFNGERITVRLYLKALNVQQQ
jgi:hypothetical protein